jgi:hypothetical protein
MSFGVRVTLSDKSLSGNHHDQFFTNIDHRGGMLSLICDTNLGVWPLTSCRISGLNSWKRLMPASLPIVEPRVLNVDEVDLAQYGR